MAKQFGQLFVSFGFFDGIEILPLDIFKQSNFKCFRIIKVANYCRNIMYLRTLGRAPTTFASNDLVTTIMRPNDDWLDNAMPSYTCRKLIELIV